MQINIDEIRRQFAALPEDALLAINRDELTRVDDTSQWASVSRFLYRYEALLATQLLRSAGVPVYLANEHILNADPGLANAIGFEVQVPLSFVEQARDILDSTVSESELSAASEAAGRELEDDRPGTSSESTG